MLKSKTQICVDDFRHLIKWCEKAGRDKDFWMKLYHAAFAYDFLITTFLRD